MPTHRRSALLLCALPALLLFGVAFGGDLPALPKAFHAKTYPAVDAHDDEKVAIAADPYDMPDKASVFVVDYKGNDYLPIRVIVSNDSDQPLSLGGMKIQMTTVNPRGKLEPAAAEDLFRRLSRQSRRGDEPQRIPVPLPRRKPKPAVPQKAQDEIEDLIFKALLVGPHSSVSGFIFLDVRDIEQPLAGGHLYLSGLRTSDGQELLYFDIPLEKYLTYRPAAR